MTDRLETESDIAGALDLLLAADPALAPMASIAGPLPLRRTQGGFAGLSAVIVAQQISKAAADSIHARLRAAVDPLDGPTFLERTEEELRATGLSRPKIRTLRAAAEAERDGLDLSTVLHLPAEDAIATLTVLPGIGRWTAECWLLFAAGHPDIFPARDLALQAAAQEAMGLDERPSEKALAAHAERWAPRRSTAARLLWAYYGASRKGAGMPV